MALEWSLAVAAIMLQAVVIAIGEIRCSCNESGCVSTGYMCKSLVGRCYSMKKGNGENSQSVRGCVDSLHMNERMICAHQMSGKSYPNEKWLICCSEDMCNYIDSTVINPKSNESMQRGYQTANVGSYGLQEVISSGSVTSLEERSTHDRDLWFKAAVIAVPIAGGFILVLLVLLAVRMLRSDSRRHKRLLHLRRERSGLTKAKLYVTDHFCDTKTGSKPSTNSSITTSSNFNCNKHDKHYLVQKEPLIFSTSKDNVQHSQCVGRPSSNTYSKDTNIHLENDNQFYNNNNNNNNNGSLPSPPRPLLTQPIFDHSSFGSSIARLSPAPPPSSSSSCSSPLTSSVNTNCHNTVLIWGNPVQTADLASVV